MEHCLFFVLTPRWFWLLQQHQWYAVIAMVIGTAIVNVRQINNHNNVSNKLMVMMVGDSNHDGHNSVYLRDWNRKNHFFLYIKYCSVIPWTILHEKKFNNPINLLILTVFRARQQDILNKKITPSPASPAPAPTPSISSFS